MIFAIQISNPIYSNSVDNHYDMIGELLEDVFFLNTEQCIMYWNHICIPLSYKYDISIILDDIIFMIEELSKATDGHLEIDWPSNTFSAKWRISWVNENIKIISEWYCIVGNIENELNKVNNINIKKSKFLAEWKKLIEKIIEVTNETNYPDKDNILFDLYRVNGLIDQYGVLYD